MYFIFINVSEMRDDEHKNGVSMKFKETIADFKKMVLDKKIVDRMFKTKLNV